MKAKIPFIILVCFALVQGWGFYVGARSTPIQTSDTRSFIPVRVDIDRTLDPPRRVVTTLPRTAAHTPPPVLYSHKHLKNGKGVTRRGAAPEVCWVFGRKMAWDSVTAWDLRRIPGIGATMAGRLIRIRDTETFTAFTDLSQFPHIGKKSIHTLQKFCYLN